MASEEQTPNANTATVAASGGITRRATFVASMSALAMSGTALHFSLRSTNSAPPSPEDVRAALLAQPNMLLDAGKALQALQDEEARLVSVPLVTAAGSVLFNEADVPFIGNPHGKNVVVEFFDYQCEYCRVAAPKLVEAVHDDPEMKVIFREIVIIAETSVPASLAALASRSQGKYEAVHNALMELPTPFTDQSILDALSKIPDVDITRLKADMSSDAVRKSLTDNISLSHQVGVSATPSFAAPGAGVLKGFRNIAGLRAFVGRAAHI